MYMKKKQNPKFYKYTKTGDKGVGGISTADSKIFLLRFHDEDSNSIQNAGSFKQQEEALTELNKYLKMGICSWVVSYNGD